MKNIRIRSFSGPYFRVFGLNTDRYFVPLPIQSEYGKMRTRITPNMDNFYALKGLIKTLIDGTFGLSNRLNDFQ